VRLLPVADGGDGTVEAVLAAVAGAEAVRVRVPAHPSAEVVVAVLPAPPRTVVAEVAQVGGLGGRRPGAAEARSASSWGAGELVAAALDLGPERLVVGVGGTASTDGGAGAVAALGARVVDDAGSPVGALGLDGVSRVAAVDLSGLDGRLGGTEVVLAADVDCPMVGPGGAARVFGPQKGLAAGDLAAADAALARWGRLLAAAAGRPWASVVEAPGAGAGGGLAGGLAAALGTVPRRGAEVVLDLVGLDAALAWADVVVTAEGSLDHQSLRGKAPVAVAHRAGARGVPCLAVAGAVTVPAEVLRAEGIVAIRALLDEEPDRAQAMALAEGLLVGATARLLRSWRPGPRG
jgi:glycerate kinase